MASVSRRTLRCSADNRPSRARRLRPCPSLVGWLGERVAVTARPGVGNHFHISVRRIDGTPPVCIPSPRRSATRASSRAPLLFHRAHARTREGRRSAVQGIPPPRTDLGAGGHRGLGRACAEAAVRVEIWDAARARVHRQAGRAEVRMTLWMSNGECAERTQMPTWQDIVAEDTEYPETGHSTRRRT